MNEQHEDTAQSQHAEYSERDTSLNYRIRRLFVPTANTVGFPGPKAKYEGASFREFCSTRPPPEYLSPHAGSIFIQVDPTNKRHRVFAWDSKRWLPFTMPPIVHPIYPSHFLWLHEEMLGWYMQSTIKRDDPDVGPDDAWWQRRLSAYLVSDRGPSTAYRPLSGYAPRYAPSSSLASVQAAAARVGHEEDEPQAQRAEPVIGSSSSTPGVQRPPETEQGNEDELVLKPAEPEVDNGSLKYRRGRLFLPSAAKGKHIATTYREFRSQRPPPPALPPHAGCVYIHIDPTDARHLVFYGDSKCWHPFAAPPAQHPLYPTHVLRLQGQRLGWYARGTLHPDELNEGPAHASWQRRITAYLAIDFGPLSTYRESLSDQASLDISASSAGRSKRKFAMADGDGRAGPVKRRKTVISGSADSAITVASVHAAGHSDNRVSLSSPEALLGGHGPLTSRCKKFHFQTPHTKRPQGTIAFKEFRSFDAPPAWTAPAPAPGSLFVQVDRAREQHRVFWWDAKSWRPLAVSSALIPHPSAPARFLGLRGERLGWFAEQNVFVPRSKDEEISWQQLLTAYLLADTAQSAAESSSPAKTHSSAGMSRRKSPAGPGCSALLSLKSSSTPQHRRFTSTASSPRAAPSARDVIFTPAAETVLFQYLCSGEHASDRANGNIAGRKVESNEGQNCAHESNDSFSPKPVETDGSAPAPAHRFSSEASGDSSKSQHFPRPPWNGARLPDAIIQAARTSEYRSMDALSSSAPLCDSDRAPRQSATLSLTKTMLPTEGLQNAESAGQQRAQKSWTQAASSTTDDSLEARSQQMTTSAASTTQDHDEGTFSTSTGLAGDASLGGESSSGRSEPQSQSAQTAIDYAEAAVSMLASGQLDESTASVLTFIVDLNNSRQATERELDASKANERTLRNHVLELQDQLVAQKAETTKMGHAQDADVARFQKAEEWWDQLSRVKDLEIHDLRGACGRAEAEKREMEGKMLKFDRFYSDNFK